MKKYILLIDDDDRELGIFISALRNIKTPFRCYHVRSTEQAMELLNYVKPDFIFIDSNNRQTKDLKCVEQISSMQRLKHVPIILYSTTINEETITRAMALGANTLSKTTSTNRLVDELNMIMDA
jgi:PleD family two-component response regulator